MEKMIVMLPIDKFDRRRDAEHLENNTLTQDQVQEWRDKGAAVLALTEFMDLCNDQEIDLGGYWISYITLKE
jgi:hypothetical protein